MLQSGATVALWDADAEALTSAEQPVSPHGAVSSAAVDITREDEVARAAAATLQRFGRIDLLANNAGIGGPICQTWEYDVETVRKIFDVNYVGTFLCCKH